MFSNLNQQLLICSLANLSTVVVITFQLTFTSIILLFLTIEYIKDTLRKVYTFTNFIGKIIHLIPPPFHIIQATTKLVHLKCKLLCNWEAKLCVVTKELWKIDLKFMRETSIDESKEVNMVALNIWLWSTSWLFWPPS